MYDIGIIINVKFFEIIINKNTLFIKFTSIGTEIIIISRWNTGSSPIVNQEAQRFQSINPKVYYWLAQ